MKKCHDPSMGERECLFFGGGWGLSGKIRAFFCRDLFEIYLNDFAN